MAETLRLARSGARPGAGPAPRLGPRQGDPRRRRDGDATPAPDGYPIQRRPARASSCGRGLRVWRRGPRPPDPRRPPGRAGHRLSHVGPDRRGRHDEPVRVRRRGARGAGEPRRAAPRRRELRGARCRAHPDRLGSPAVPPRAPPARGRLAIAPPDRHRVHARAQRDPRPRGARRGDAAGSPRGVGHRPVDRAGRGREPPVPVDGGAAVAGQLRLRAGARLRLLLRAPRDRASPCRDSSYRSSAST